MSYSAPGAGAGLYKFLSVMSAAERTIPATAHQDSDAIEIAKWQITKDAIIPAEQIPIPLVSLVGIFKKDSGSGSVGFAIDTSPDDVNWTAIDSVTTVSATEEGAIINDSNKSTSDTDFFIRVAAYNSGSSAAGTIRKIKAVIQVLLPIGFSVTQVI